MKWINQIATKLGILRAEIIIIVGLVLLFLVGILAQVWQGAVSRERLLKEIRAEIFYETEADSLIEADSLLLELSNPYPTLIDSQMSTGEFAQKGRRDEQSRISGSTSVRKEGQKLNFNLATEDELLKTLPYIDPSLANRMIRFRTAQGGKLQSLDQLLMVRGIGEKTLDRFRRYLTIDSVNTR